MNNPLIPSDLRLQKKLLGRTIDEMARLPQLVGSFAALFEQIHGHLPQETLREVRDHGLLHDKWDVVEQALRAGCDHLARPGQPDPLQISVDHNLTTASRLLLQFHPGFPDGDPDGGKLLLQAAKHGNFDLMEILLAAGANPTVTQPNQGKTAWEVYEWEMFRGRISAKDEVAVEDQRVMYENHHLRWTLQQAEASVPARSVPRI
jgi:ankyrin repeat protein